MDANWPFFEPRHRDLVARLAGWAEALPAAADDARTRLARLAEAEVLADAVPDGDAAARVDCRSLFIIREQLARFDPASDRALLAQAMGAAALLRGSPEQRQLLAAARCGDWLLVLAHSVGAAPVTMERDGDDIVLDGLVGIGGVEHPDAVIVLAGQTLPSAFLVVRGTRGLGDAGRLMLEGCRVPQSARIAGEGEGMRIAVSVRELFGASAAAAAIGLARAILDRIADRLVDRATFGRRLPSYQEGQTRLADLATRIDAADLVTYRAAWARDHQQALMPRESAMARLCAFDAVRAALDSAESLLADQPEWLAAMQAQGGEIARGHDRDVEQLLLAGQTLNLLRPAVDGWRGLPRVGAR